MCVGGGGVSCHVVCDATLGATVLDFVWPLLPLVH